MANLHAEATRVVREVMSGFTETNGSLTPSSQGSNSGTVTPVSPPRTSSPSSIDGSSPTELPVTLRRSSHGSVPLLNSNSDHRKSRPSRLSNIEFANVRTDVEKHPKPVDEELSPRSVSAWKGGIRMEEHFQEANKRDGGKENMK